MGIDKRQFLVVAALALAIPARASSDAGGDSKGDRRRTLPAEAAGAQPSDGASGGDAKAAPEREDGPKVRARTEQADDVLARYYQIKAATQRQLLSGQGTVHIFQLVEEMIDEVVDDVKRLNMDLVSPTAVRNVSLTSNLSAQFGDMIRALMLSAIANSTPMTIKHCVACTALRSRIEDGDWVVTAGVTGQEALVREAETLNVETFMDVHFGYFPGANTVVMDVAIFDAGDGAVRWAETYRSDSTTAAILRSGDRVLTRDERLAELERKLEARPYYGHILYGGAAYIPYDSPLGGIRGASLGYRLYERFGEERRWTFGIGAEMFANISKDNPLLGTFLGGTLLYEIFAPNLNSATFRTGPTVQGFFAGQEGNSFALEWGLDVVFQFRLGAGVSVFYFLPVKYADFDLGGFGGKARLSFNW